MLTRPLIIALVGLGSALVGGGSCVSEVPVPRCGGDGCGNDGDAGNDEPPRLFVDPPFGLGFDCVTLGCDVERRMVVENRGGGTIQLVLARLDVDSSADFTLRTGTGAPLPFDEPTAIAVTPTTPLELFVRYVPRDGLADQGSVILDWHDAAVAFDDAVLERVELPLSSRALGDVAASTTTTRLNFGFVPLGGYATRSVTVDNSGAGGILGVGPVSLADGTPPVFVEPFAGAWGEQFANPGESAEVVVSFRPTSAGTFTGMLEVATTDGGVPALRIELAGTTSAAPDAVVSGPSLDFASIRVDSQRTLPLVIENRGGSPLSVTGSVVSGANVSLEMTGTVEVAPLERATFPVRWAPTAGGPLLGRIVFATNDPAEPQIAIDVSGFANAPVLASSPASVSFGSVVQGWTTEAQSFELRNTGFGELTISSLTFDVGSSSQIRFAEVPTLPLKLSADDPPVRVSVFMEASLLGTQTATILVGTDGVDGPLGQGGIGRLTASGLVVTCEVGCPVQNGTPSCGTGACTIGSCRTAFHDADNSFASGCECNEDPVLGANGIFRDVGNQCGDPGFDLGTVSDSSSEIVVTGTLHSQTDADLYFIRFDDGSDDDYGARVRFVSGPPGLRLVPRFADDSAACTQPSGGALSPGQSREGNGCSSFLCTGNDSESGVFRVEWAPGASPQCASYTIAFDANANY